MLSAHMKRAVGALTPWDQFIRATEALGLEHEL